MVTEYRTSTNNASTFQVQYDEIKKNDKASSIDKILHSFINLFDSITANSFQALTQTSVVTYLNETATKDVITMMKRELCNVDRTLDNHKIGMALNYANGGEPIRVLFNVTPSNKL